ncbi:MAG: ABC transporter substrate-binding protein [Actinomycetota bacterium]|nr:ABC transporter substrate-binding protein [Actinomycetota bacterium]MDA3028037.1 ABC transporter substrate-binding protein [Actinomycetota bacterium]
MRTTKSRMSRLLAVPVALSMLAAACGGSEETAETTEPEAATTTEARQVNTDTGEQTTTTVAAEVTTTTEPIPPASGTLRMVEFSPVTTFNPAGSQTAQSAYLYPAYDTLTRQTNDLTVVPALATGWTRPDDVTWEFTLRDDVVFHDGAAFNAQVAVDNFNYHASFQGNPNAATWSNMVEARVVDDTTFQVEFASPNPSFPLEMSMVMGMMISPNFLDGSDLTRNPQGSGPWIWSEEESEAGVTEVYNLNPEHWNPADQGVEQVTVTLVADNNARMNALLTGEADIMATTRDAQLQTGLDAGMMQISVPNYFPYVFIIDREGDSNPALADIRVRQAILKAMDLEAYNDSIHAGKGDGASGIFPPAFGEFHDPALAASTYDPEGARALLAEAGYGDGLTINMPMMPAISPHMDIIVQMLGAVGITVEIDQINNGELGPRFRSGQSALTWNRALLVHPAKDLGFWIGENAPMNPFNLTDTNDLYDKLQEALSSDPDTAKALYSEITQGLIDMGALIPLGHGGQNGMYAPNVTGVVMGLNMQAPMPYGVRVDG